MTTVDVPEFDVDIQGFAAWLMYTEKAEIRKVSLDGRKRVQMTFKSTEEEEILRAEYLRSSHAGFLRYFKDIQLQCSDLTRGKKRRNRNGNGGD